MCDNKGNLIKVMGFNKSDVDGDLLFLFCI